MEEEKISILSLIPEELRAQLKQEVIAEMEEEKRKKEAELKLFDQIIENGE